MLNLCLFRSRCVSCGEYSSADSVRSLHSRLTDDLRKLDRSDPDVLDNFLKTKLSVLVADTHQLVREIQYGQVTLLKREDNAKVATEKLLKKSYLCE